MNKTLDFYAILRQAKPQKCYVIREWAPAGGGAAQDWYKIAISKVRVQQQHAGRADAFDEGKKSCDSNSISIKFIQCTS